MSGSDSLIGGIVGAVIGVVGTLATGWFGYLNTKADVDAKMIELSVGILRSEVTHETLPLRQWAIQVLEEKAQANFNDKQKDALLNQELPYKGPTLVPLRLGDWVGYVNPKVLKEPAAPPEPKPPEPKP